MLRNYLLVAWKVLQRRRFYTFISLFGIAFTLMVLMVAASLLDHLFGAHAPESRADRLLSTWMVQANGNDWVSNGPPGYMFCDRYVRTMKTPEKVTVHSFFETALAYINGVSQEFNLKRTDGVFWQVMDFQFLEGGPYSARDEAERNFVAVINEATRRRYFGEQSAVGRFIDLDGQRFRVVGVVENVPWFRLASFADVWVPISTAKNDNYKAQFFGNFAATALARSAADRKRVQDEYAAVLQRVEMPDKHSQFATGGLESLFETASRMLFSRDHRMAQPGRLLAWLLGIAVLFMLLPTINLVNINVSRIIERASEIGVRKAFGASSWTLVGQFIVENVVLTLVGGGLGLLLTLGALRLLEISNLIPYASFGLNGRVFLYGLAMTLFFGVLSGVYPAWKMSRLHPVLALRGGAR